MNEQEILKKAMSIMSKRAWAKLSPEERKAKATKAIRARWDKRKPVDK